MSKSSSNSDTHPYMRGYIFWSKQRFWIGGHVTPKGVEYFEESLEAMRDDKKLINIDKTLTRGGASIGFEKSFHSKSSQKWQRK